MEYELWCQENVVSNNTYLHEIINMVCTDEIVNQPLEPIEYE